MDEATVIRLIRRDIREPVERRVSAPDILQSIALAINDLGETLQKANPSHFTVRKSLSSDTHVFTPPTALHRSSRIWDLMCNAIFISGAADDGGGLIELTTATAHGLATGNTVIVHDIVGTVEGNGTWKITVTGLTTFTLDESVFADEYESGGKCFVDSSFFDKIPRKPGSEDLHYESGSRYRWFSEAGNIVVDDAAFTNDILIKYTYLPTTVAEIPTDFQYGIVSWVVLDLILLPEKKDPKFPDLNQILQKHMRLWPMYDAKAKKFKLSEESDNLSDYTKRFSI